MKQTAVLLFIILLLFGCTSVPKKGTEESAGAVSKVEIEAEEKKAPETEKKVEQVILEELTLFSKEYSYYADGLLDNYTVFTYRENSTELLKEELYNDLNELTEKVYYEYHNGTTSKKESYDSEGRRKYYRVYSYNDRNLLKSESSFDGEGNLQTVSKYEYGGSGNRVKWSLYDDSGAMLAYNTYLYEDNKNIRIDFFNPSGKLEKYSIIEYDTDSNKVKESLYFPSKKLESYTLYDYKDNLLILESSFKGSEKHIRSVSYEYDQEGNILRIKYLDKDKTLIEIKERKYIHIKL